MARTAITLRSLSPNGGIAAPTADTIDQANGMNLAIPSNTIPLPAGSERLILVVANTAGTPKAVTVKAGVGGGATPGQAFRSGLGDASVTVTNATTSYLGPFESARFSQLDGSLNVDFASGFTGSITALLMSRLTN